MTEPDLLNRIALLEQQVGEFLPAALERKRSGLEPGDWLMAQVRAKAEIGRDQANMSVIETAEIRIIGDIDDAMALSAHDQLEAARLSPGINVLIDTEGGNFDAAVRIYRAIRWHPGTKRAKLGKRCMSAGVLISMACDHRVASANSQYLMHLTADSPDGRDRWTLLRHIAAMRQLRKLDSLYLNVIADRSGADLAALAMEAAKDEQQSLQWCLQNNLITAIEEVGE
ncbi:ATP-dependent Clp protease proteolytic subunit [Mesorhizobium sp. dw_380]|uniref:ATP-dependent Clp protease proteolytic subunit n=1 Tax=Mesorhizobium sp. dw_380 TaxID=2812001 RepID=UPI001BDEB82D|nr:ATP-dependent Clp protease proteolytic subunit [Mesorhizobium sp. dw_380]